MDGWLQLGLLWVVILAIVWFAIKVADKTDKDRERHEKEQLEREYLMKKIESLEKKDDEKNL